MAWLCQANSFLGYAAFVMNLADAVLLQVLFEVRGEFQQALGCL
jgi:hypothetical protein